MLSRFFDADPEKSDIGEITGRPTDVTADDADTRALGDRDMTSY